MLSLAPSHHLPVKNHHELLDFLLQRRLLLEDQKDIVLAETRISKDSVPALLLSLGFVQEEDLYQALSTLSGYPFVDVTKAVIHDQLLRRIPLSVAFETCSLPIVGEHRDGLTFVMADPSDLKARDELSLHLEKDVRLHLALGKRSDILSFLQKMQPHPVGDFHLPPHWSAEEVLQELITKAVFEQGSDVHCEPQKAHVVIKFRADGLLHTVGRLHVSRWITLCNQIKVMANMDIAESHKPQDGRFMMTILGRTIHFRVSSHPTIHGESIVIRILERHPQLTKLEYLGYSQRALERIQEILAKPEGLVVITGPTGSGKTTSLYSMLEMLDTQHLNIMTLEEPVEYRLHNIRQSEVKDHTALTFVSGMHSILRQDPDVILLGEIRDAQTAHMALRASMTGHRVFTTLHTHHAWGTVQRFLDFDIPSSLCVGLFSGMIAQRLVRRLCSVCKKERLLSPEEAKAFRIWPQLTVYEAVGCSSCGLQGYKGRQAIAEVILMDAELDSLILTKASFQDVQYALQRRGVKSLFEEGKELVLSGITSLEEVYRVVGVHL